MTVTVENLREGELLALRLNSLPAAPSDYMLYDQDGAGALRKVTGSWTLCAEGSGALDQAQTLNETQLREIRLSISDGCELDQSEEEYQGIFNLVLLQKLSAEG